MPLGPCSCKPQASSSRGWAWAAFSRRLGRGRGSGGEKPSRKQRARRARLKAGGPTGQILPSAGSAASLHLLVGDSL